MEINLHGIRKEIEEKKILMKIKDDILLRTFTVKFSKCQ